VHTPASYVQKYGSDEAAWERFLTDIEALPRSLAVVGVNDYLFIDGYRRLLAEKAAGRLRNIETIFPVIELRLARLAGTDKLSRVNYHVIFSEELHPDAIESQFLVQLRGSAQLSPEAENVGVRWKGFVNRGSIEELGAVIRATVPAEELHKFGETDFELGMNNINFDQDGLKIILDSGLGVHRNYITAVGKAEWDQFRWNDHSIAEKKNIINLADAVFIAAADVSAFQRARQSLIDQNVNNKLLDCSDAHDFAHSEDKDRIGNCLLWIKSDPTFLGLKAALQDYEDRVFVGDEPPVFERMRTQPRRFMISATFDRTPVSGSTEKWFEGRSLELNPELVTIIGNRGSGKSALLDCLAFAASSAYPVNGTSFLKRFRGSKDGKAADFAMTINWCGGDPSVVCLADEQRSGASPMAKHLPQHFIDQLCNERGDDFASELEQAIFSHVREDERLQTDNLRELVRKRAHGIDVAVEALRVELSRLNTVITRLENQSHPVHVAEIRSQVAALKQELNGLFQNRKPRPSQPLLPSPDDRDRLALLKTKLREISEELEEKRITRNQARASIESARRLRSNVNLVKQRIDEIGVECKKDLELLGIQFGDIVKLELSFLVLDEIESKLADEKAILDAALNEDEEAALPAEKKRQEEAVAEFTKGMTEPQQKYEAALQGRADIREQIREKIGSPEQTETVRGLQAQLFFVENDLEIELAAKRRERIGISSRLFAEQQRLVAIFEELYGPVKSFVEAHKSSEGTLDVAFEARLEDKDLEGRISDLIAHNRKGTFLGVQEGSEQLTERVSSVDFNSWPSVEQFLVTLVNDLCFDQREAYKGEQRHIHDQLKCGDPSEFYDFVFGLSYLNPQYRITLNGKPLEELSSGEKGALLLVFYLLVDMSDVPLLIDQPEENLDNQSVFAVLRPFVREARSRRQVILVTHNPNIAVAAGADQVIYCSIDKASDYQVSYETGALENPAISKRIVDVLEGTMPAFQKREKKYELTA